MGEKTEHNATDQASSNKHDLSGLRTDEDGLAQLGHRQELNLCSLAEIAAMYPTAGGQYHWVAVLSTTSTRSSAAYMTGWISVGGQIVLSAAAAFSAGLQIQALVTFNDDNYTPTRWQGMLFYWAVLVYSAVQNVWGIKLLPQVNGFSGIIHILPFIAIVVVLGLISEKNPSSFVFKDVVNSSGWDSDAVSWLVGLASLVYPFIGYDAACHMAEELPNPSRNVPLAMVSSVVINGLMGLVYCIVLLYATGPLETLLTSRTGFPFIDIYYEAAGSRAGASTMAAMPIFIAVVASLAGITSTSRTLWAFARDEATPFDKQLSKVDQKLKVPTNAILTVFTFQALLGLIYLGSPAAFNAVLSMAVVGMYLSYIIPIAYMTFCGRKNIPFDKYRHFNLGRYFGPVLNWISMLWIALIIVFSTFPIETPVTAQNMNYASVVMCAWVVVGAWYYMMFGRQKFKVPLASMPISVGIP
ncbi:hypothetical protein FSARC_12598 [Fusarium sarcochroum]|uniref:Amino acid permease n=1 Tax=Fusarium sarcochroum TaxID=1208366 RepID=A0A8H4WWR6_9HYPO|nr:hypothetical protein FSARC_12598 [Fusarium sarcochroum]